MNSRLTLLLTATVLWIALAARPTPAQTEYKEYRRSVTLDLYFTISGDNKGNIRVSAPDSSVPVTVHIAPGDSIATGEPLAPAPDLTIWEDSIRAGDHMFDLTKVVDLAVEQHSDTAVIHFFTSSDTSRARMRLKQGNIIHGLSPVQIPASQFVRGHVVSIGGGVTIHGEVNKDVISIFGAVTVDPGGVVRGAVVSLAREVTVHPQAIVYGRLLSPRQKKAYRHQLWSRDREFRIDPDIRYDRVDGLDLFMGFAFEDHDSTLPSIWAKGGYAFESERWRYRFGVEQTLRKAPSVVVGGEAFRRLASDDDWLLNDYENLAFVVLAREDFKDYYESEGGRLYVTFNPLHRLRVNADFKVEETHWLDAHPRLWAVFGGHKRFRDNFSTVDRPARDSGQLDIEDKTLAGPALSIKYDTRSTGGILDSAGWAVKGKFEWSVKDWSSDFDFRRYSIEATRFQKISRESIVLLRAMFGSSDGYLPMHRRFYLGGLGTLHGYGQKELSGTRFWLANAEYRVTIPGSEFALSALWDVGQMANNSRLDSDVEVKHSIGLAGYIGSDFRLTISKRLDRSGGDAPKIFVKLTHPF
ncbi:MAG: BamA/TamA family outer membrane protein [candidate division Zixibacteria bacterium]|nr:BamA/TamA family outer membrane protein [candidate division Zixibacteria bacterium]